ncbi:MAG: zinc finger domain-containing protein [Methanomicrobiales archaeon]|nr:zinc finger domain-containing protein [Methanomicrobiales archaeon]
MEFGKCTSCGAPIAEQGATEFGCPECSAKICRCARCRHQSVVYICPACGFRGP